MKKDEAEAILADFEALDNQLGWREESGTLREGEHGILLLVQLARPFLKTFGDIADSLTHLTYHK